MANKDKKSKKKKDKIEDLAVKVAESMSTPPVQSRTENPIESDNYVIISCRVYDAADEMIAFIEKNALAQPITGDNEADLIELRYPAILRMGIDDQHEIHYAVVPGSGDSMIIDRKDIVNISYPVKLRPAKMYFNMVSEYQYNQRLYMMRESFKFKIEKMAENPIDLSEIQAKVLAQFTQNNNKVH